VSDLSTIDAEGFKALLGEKGKHIEVAWIESLVAAGVTMTMHPFDPADIAAAVNPDIKPLFAVGGAPCQ